MRYSELAFSAKAMAATAKPRPSGSGYDILKARHKQAYVYLSRALEIDESGVGKPQTAGAILRFDGNRGVAPLKRALVIAWL